MRSGRQSDQIGQEVEKDMEQHFKGFLKDMEVRNYSPTSISKYAHCVKMLLEHFRQNQITDIRKVGREELQVYSKKLSENPRFGLSYVASNIRAVKCFFRFLKKTNAVLYDFSVILKEPKMGHQLPKEPMTPKEVKLMLEAPDLRTPLGIRDRAIFETFYSTGIRLAEMTNLTLLDLNLGEGLLFVREGKGRKDRMVPLGKHACFFIQRYLEASRKALLAKGKATESVKSNRVWISKRGKPLGKMDINFMVRHYRKKAGIERSVTAHSFRRTLAVELIRNQCDFLSVKTILGHSRSETTLRYCALSGVELKEAMKQSHPRHDVEDNEDPTPRIERVS